MDKKIQIFVSSTFKDLMNERTAAMDAIHLSNNIPVGMEKFPAGNETPLDTVKKWIDDSDALLLLLGGKYGTIEPQSNLSYVEVEYNYASLKKKPIIPLVMSEEFLHEKEISLGNAVTEHIHVNKYNAFKQLVELNKHCNYFTDTKDLQMKTILAIKAMTENKDNNFIGWVRGNKPLSKIHETTHIMRGVSASNYSQMVSNYEIGDVQLCYYPFLDPMHYKLGSIKKKLSCDASPVCLNLTATLEDVDDIRLVYGPYRSLPIVGRYRAHFYIKLRDFKDSYFSDDTNIAMIDVYDYFGGKVTLSHQILNYSHFKKGYNIFSLEFDYMDIAQVLEYRIGVFNTYDKRVVISTDRIKVERVM